MTTVDMAGGLVSDRAVVRLNCPGSVPDCDYFCPIHIQAELNLSNCHIDPADLLPELSVSNYTNTDSVGIVLRPNQTLSIVWF